MIFESACKILTVATICATASVHAQSLDDKTSGVAQPLNGAADSIQAKLYSTFDKNRDAIVKVYAQKAFTVKDKDGKDTEQLTLDVGSGFLIGKDGIVMTSAYITNGANKLWVEWHGLLLDATSVGFDPLTTSAIVRVGGDFKSKNANIITIDKSANLPRIATMLLAISYEMGLPPSPRMGLATAHNIEFGGNFLPTVYVRTNIAAPRGSTGGAVFDLDGEFVGMTIASLPEIGGSFILPAKAAARIRDDILLCGEPIYSWFGLRAEDADGFDNTKVIVRMVAENAPAKKAGFMVGDEILEINSQKVINNTQLRNITFFVRPNETAVFKIRRGGEILKLEVLADRLSSDVIRAAVDNISPRATLNETKISEAMKTNSQTNLQKTKK